MVETQTRKHTIKRNQPNYITNEKYNLTKRGKEYLRFKKFR